MKYTSKDFRKNNAFVLYDMNDNLICYFDNFNELSKIIGLQLRNIVINFKESKNNCICVVLDNKFYKLYTFV